ncbi:hypothetical protein [Planctomicrobium sp. SH527]|uniref:hypothetical protein n=1 Tax=Planctomicrobium sp. SH527 TaxID=3448123 RepID=UPI003F5AF1BD
MLRKVAFGVLAMTTLGGFVLGTDMFSYLRTGLGSVRSQLRAEVPIEFEIERAKQEVERLLPQVRKSMHLIAEEQVEVAQLQTSIARKETQLNGQESAILTMRNDLKKDDSTFRYAGHRYSRKDVERDLSERFNRYKIAEETVKREQQVLAAKLTALTANRETLEGMLSQKKTLEAELARLEARVRTVAARKEINGLQVDSSQLTKVKSLIASIEKRLDIEDAVLAAEGDLNGLIPVDQEDAAEENEDVASAVDLYFKRGAEERQIEQVDF